VDHLFHVSGLFRIRVGPRLAQASTKHQRLPDVDVCKCKSCCCAYPVSRWKELSRSRPSTSICPVIAPIVTRLARTSNSSVVCRYPVSIWEPGQMLKSGLSSATSSHQRCEGPWSHPAIDILRSDVVVFLPFPVSVFW
jgi:hypothetical protein